VGKVKGEKVRRAHPFPRVYLVVGVDERDVRYATGMRVNCGGFGDEQGARFTSTLGIIFYSKVTMNVVFVCPNPGHGTENDTMLEVHVTDANRLKEFRHGHCDESGGCRRSAGVRRL
jgi:hypothetical protein